MHLGVYWTYVQIIPAVLESSDDDSDVTAADAGTDVTVDETM